MPIIKRKDRKTRRVIFQAVCNRDGCGYRSKWYLLEREAAGLLSEHQAEHRTVRFGAVGRRWAPIPRAGTCLSI
jgi:hypothetical protein